MEKNKKSDSNMEENQKKPTKKEYGQVYYTLKEVRIVFGNKISETTLLTMVRNGEIPCKKVMAKIFIPQWWMDELVDSAINPPTVKK